MNDLNLLVWRGKVESLSCFLSRFCFAIRSCLIDSPCFARTLLLLLLPPQDGFEWRGNDGISFDSTNTVESVMLTASTQECVARRCANRSALCWFDPVLFSAHTASL